ncbi:TPA: phage tail protein [Enterobacter hormaechei subsp. xiangfangensis]|nr:phage tail protein [Enterobacter hormaechei subsp. xiangfangensis]HAV1890656.1 phage tail protein [Enterobacter hormaechei subsp. xiangfangensis]
MAELPKADNGTYQTEGLAPRQFNKVFRQIKREQIAKRRKAMRTLTPSILRNKKAEDILKLGRKEKAGTLFTLEDLKSFEVSREALKKAFKSKEKGITYHQLISHCRAIDVQRANNRSGDGRGITTATFIGLQHNVARISVKASSVSKHGHHRVKIRFEGWQDALDMLEDNPESELKVAKQLCAGLVSFDCDCGRHQYWYRYIATAGRFAITPPAEYAYPKIRNPKLEGVACKHVIHTLTRFQSGSWQKLIGKYLQRAAKQIGFGDDRKRTVHFNEEEIKEAHSERANLTNLTKIKAEYKRYQRQQEQLSKQLKKPGKTITQLRSKLKGQRKLTEAEKTRRKQAEDTVKKQKAEIAELRKREQQRKKDEIAIRKQGFIDAMMMTGMTREQANKAYAATLTKKG